MSGSPLSDSEEREIAEALVGRRRGRGPADRSVGLSAEAPDPPPPTSSSESAASAEAITSEDAERALADLDSIMAGGGSSRGRANGGRAAASASVAGSDSAESLAAVPDLPPPPGRGSDPDLSAVREPAPPPAAQAGIDGGWKRVGMVGGGRLGKPGRPGSVSGSGGTAAVAGNGGATSGAAQGAATEGGRAGSDGVRGVIGASSEGGGVGSDSVRGVIGASSGTGPSGAPGATGAFASSGAGGGASTPLPPASAAAAAAAISALAMPTGPAPLPPPPVPPPPPPDDDDAPADEEPTDEEPTDEGFTDEEPTDEEATDEEATDEDAPPDDGAPEDDGPPPDEEVPGESSDREAIASRDPDADAEVEAPRAVLDEEDDRGIYPEPPPLPVVQGDDDEAPAARREEPTSEHDLFLGELARLQRFVNAEQVAEAVRISQKLRAEGRPKKIGKIMVKLGFLTATQAKYLLKLQRTPDPIEGYKLLERRGQGGMGVVYRAVQKSMRREVALKILAPKWAAHARFLQRFFREAKLAGTLNHPNIVSAIDVGECKGLHYYAMEYVDGWSISEMLKEDGPFDESEALDIVVQVAKALKEASAQAIIHRDVKPENILVTPDGVAKLADLGLSKQLTSDCSITTEGKTLGTPFYVSPELARGQRDVDVRSDIYSLGATLYHMLTGRPPFEGDQPAMIMARHIAEAHVSARKVRPDISQAASKLVDRMMAKDPAKRYASADDLIKDVVAIRKGKNPFSPQTGRGGGGGGGGGGRSERGGGAARRAENAPDSDSDSNSARIQAQPARRITTAPERPAYGAAGGSTQNAGIIAAVITLVCAIVVVAIIAKGKSDQGGGAPGGGGSSSGGGSSAGAESSGASSGSGASSAATAGPSAPAHASPERERAVQARWAGAQPEIGRNLLQGRYDEAARLADTIANDAAGTVLEGAAKDLKERVARETRTAADMALKSARRALADGDARRAQDFLEGAPRVDAPDLSSERARLKDEIERALRK